MESSIIPGNEAERMELLHDLNILDTEGEEIYDSIVYLASKICQVPISTITLVDRHRQWFKSAIGVAHKENPRIHSFCARAILGNDILEVPDSLKDHRFKDNPLAQAEPGVRFYAGVPLALKDGLKVGTLCVIDNKPNKLTDEQLKSLRYLSWQVTKLLELRLKNKTLSEQQTALNDDLKAAANIQRSFLPAPELECDGFHIASFWAPAHVLDGDIFNVIRVNGHLIFYMVDVCGHDVPSALVTISISQFFQQLANSSTDLSPKTVMQTLNNEYPFERFERFFTIFYFIVETGTTRYRYSSSGHPAAIIFKKNGQMKLLDHHGMFIGLKNMVADGDLIFDEGEGVLEAGDKVFIYTDGLIELKNQQGKEFGPHRLYTLLKTLCDEPITKIVEKVREAIKNYSDCCQDDVSMLGFEKK